MNKKLLGIINVGYIVALAIVLIPLVVLAHYSVPIADDWMYGASIKRTIESGGNFFDIIFDAFKLMCNKYFRGRAVSHAC